MAARGRRKKIENIALRNIVLVGVIFLVVAIVMGSTVIYFFLLSELPSIAVLKDYRPSIAT